MQEIFWLRHGRIAGRCGPNLKPWIPQQFAAAGIGAILSVNDAASVYADDIAGAGIDYRCLSLADNAPPREGDFELCLERLPQALEFILAATGEDKAVLIHCTSGKDRTGLVMCHYLCQCEQMQPEAALAEVRRVRPIALSATGYEVFGLEVLSELKRLS